MTYDYGDKYGDRLRDCAICGKPVLRRPYQSSAARACSPGCARALAVQEHPDLGGAHVLLNNKTGPLS